MTKLPKPDERNEHELIIDGHMIAVVCLSVCLFVYLSVCLHVYLSVCLHVCLYICMSVCLSFYTLVLWPKDEEGTGLGHWHHSLLQLQISHWPRSWAVGYLGLLFLIITLVIDPTKHYSLDIQSKPSEPQQTK